MNDLFNSLFKDKKKIVLLLIGILGIALIFASLGENEEKRESATTLDEYKEKLESELELLCESIKGAGKCEVTVTFSEGEHLEYKGSNIIGSEPPRVLGVTVVCKGGSDLNVKRNISDCMTALFDIGSNRVCVLEMK